MHKFILLILFFSGTALANPLLNKATEAALAKLPPYIQIPLKKSTKIFLKDLGKISDSLGCDKNTNPSVVAYTRPNFLLSRQDIYVNKNIFDKEVTVCRFNNFETYLESVLIHEFAHVIDHLGLASNYSCDSYSESLNICNPLNYFKLSQTAKFQTIVNGHKAINLRSPNPYENTNSSEFFAVNFEHFLLDTQMKCRRPFLYNYFKDLFNWEPEPTITCGQNFWGLIQNDGKIFSIDPSRVYRIDYYLAGSGPAIYSKWGHSMFRIVVCAPSRALVNSQCLEDQTHHIVFNFGAYVNDEDIEILPGLVGSYTSSVYFSTLEQAHQFYEIKEGRKLYAYPLRFSEKEKVLFLQRLFEQYWSRVDKYYFFNNNCAHESLRLIQLAIADLHPLQAENVLTPKGLLQSLQNHNLLDKGHVQKINSFINQSTQENSLSLGSAENNLKIKYSEYKLLDLNSRKFLHEKLNTNDVYFFYVLQSHHFNQLLSHHLAKSEKIPSKPAQYSNQWDILEENTGYGIPFSNEVPKLELVRKSLSERQKSALRDYQNLLKTIFSNSPDILEEKKFLNRIKEQILQTPQATNIKAYPS